MAGTTSAVRVWTGADVYAAPVGTTAPTNIASALNAAFEPLGLISQDDAIGEEFSSEDTELFAYGSVFVRKTSIKQKLTLTLTALENSDLVFELANPGSTSAASGGITTRTVKPRNLGLAIRAIVLEKTDGTITSRIHIPRGQVTISGSRNTSDNEMYGTPLVIDVLGSEDGQGNTFFYTEITNDSAAAPSGS
jgi:hypothetical protein